jgi:hypothetical protein
MLAHRFTWMTLLTAVVVVLTAPEPHPLHLPGSAPDPLPGSLELPAPAAPAVPKGEDIELVRPPAAKVTTEQRAIGAMVTIPAAPVPKQPPPPTLSVELPSPAGALRGSRPPTERIWAGERSSPPPPPPGTPRTGWVDDSN